MGLDFTCATTDGLTACRFITSSGEGVVDTHWPGLFESWSGLEPERSPFFRFAVNNNNGEEMAVYLGLAWALTDRPERLAVLHYEWYTLKMWCQREPDAWAAWDFLVDVESCSAGREETWKSARSGLPRNGPESAIDKRYESSAGMYDLVAEDDLRDLALAALSDAAGEITLFGLADRARRDMVAESLAGHRRPDLGHLLGEGDRMVHLAFGVDGPFYDSILVVGRDVEEEVQEVAERFTAAARAYEASIPGFGGVDDVLTALGRLRSGQC